jgi:nucleoside-diphosphate-sugar epimerase
MGLGPVGTTQLLVTGSNGRIGRALRAIWAENRAGGLPVLWHGRTARPGVDLVWDIGTNPPAILPPGLIILHLAGCTTGNAPDLAENLRITAAVCHASRAARASHVFVMSSAAVYRPGPTVLTEADSPAPISPYGQAKLDAERMATHLLAGQGITLLRLANVAGADALLGNCQPSRTVTLDPIAGQTGGPERSYIGPRVLADVLSRLVALVDDGAVLPPILNLAQPGTVSMAGLLTAYGQPWQFGLPRHSAVARVAVATDLLTAILPVPHATPAGLIADMTSVPGWPR